MIRKLAWRDKYISELGSHIRTPLPDSQSGDPTTPTEIKHPNKSNFREKVYCKVIIIHSGELRQQKLGAAAHIAHVWKHKCKLPSDYLYSLGHTSQRMVKSVIKMGFPI